MTTTPEPSTRPDASQPEPDWDIIERLRMPLGDAFLAGTEAVCQRHGIAVSDNVATPEEDEIHFDVQTAFYAAVELLGREPRPEANLPDVRDITLGQLAAALEFARD